MRRQNQALPDVAFTLSLVDAFAESAAHPMAGMMPKEEEPAPTEAPAEEAPAEEAPAEPEASE